MLTIVHAERGAVDERVTLSLAARPLGQVDVGLLALLDGRIVHDQQLAVAVDDDEIAVLVRDGVDVDELHLAGRRRLVPRLLGQPRGRTTDVERTHGELRAGPADRLGGDDADRFADLDQLAAGEVTAVAAAADSAARLAGEHRADLDLLDTRFLDGVREVFGDLVVVRHELVARERIVDLFL